MKQRDFLQHLLAHGCVKVVVIRGGIIRFREIEVPCLVTPKSTITLRARLVAISALSNPKNSDQASRLSLCAVATSQRCGFTPAPSPQDRALRHRAIRFPCDGNISVRLFRA